MQSNDRNHMRFPIGDGEQIYSGIKTTRVHIRMNNCLLKDGKGLAVFIMFMVLDK